MPRIPYPDPASLPEHIRKVIEAVPLNVTRMTAGLSPAVFDGFRALSTSFHRGSKLTADTREIAVLRVGYLSNAAYEVYQHEEMARQAGLNDAQVAAIKRGGKNPDVFSASQQAVLDFTDDLVLNVRPGDATLGEIRKHLSDQSLLDLIMLIGLYMTISRILETTGIELDPSRNAGILSARSRQQQQ